MRLRKGRVVCQGCWRTETANAGRRCTKCIDEGKPAKPDPRLPGCASGVPVGVKVYKTHGAR